jgi:ankyrin repeat protein
MRKRLKAVGIKGVVLNDHEDAILACLHREIAGAEGGDNESEESSGDEASFRTFATSPPVPRIVVQNHISTVDYNYSPQHSASIWHRHSFKSGIKSISALFRHSPSTGARPQIDGIAQRLFTSNTKFLFAAANGDISEVKRVLASGAGPDVVAHENICGETALHVAAKHGHIEIVRLLCDFGVNLNANTTRVGASPLYYAVKYHQIAAVKLLLDYGAGPFVGRESLDIIINMDGRELLETFMDAMEDIELWYEYILFQATSQKRKSIIQAVLDRGSRSNLRFGSEFLDIVIQGGDCSILLQLLGGALDPCHVSDADGMSCLSRAARRGNESMVQALISYGADPQVTDISGKTPLHEAARWGSLETMQLLIESGADVNALDGHGRSPLHAAIGGAIPSLVNNILALLFLNGVRPETLDHDGMAALHVAVKQGDEGVVEALLDLGASVLTVDGSGETPLGLALSAIEPDPNLISLLRREEKKWGSTSGELFYLNYKLQPTNMLRSYFGRLCKPLSLLPKRLRRGFKAKQKLLGG